MLFFRKNLEKHLRDEKKVLYLHSRFGNHGQVGMKICLGA